MVQIWENMKEYVTYVDTFGTIAQVASELTSDKLIEKSRNFLKMNSKEEFHIGIANQTLKQLSNITITI